MLVATGQCYISYRMRSAIVARYSAMFLKQLVRRHFSGFSSYFGSRSTDKISRRALAPGPGRLGVVAFCVSQNRVLAHAG
jgi:hypothetical protein